MKTETPPTIAELWGRLEQMSITGNPCTPWTYEWHKWHGTLNTLRQQLLERCEKVWDADGVYTRFTIYTERGVTNPRTFVQSMGGSRFDTPETAANYIGAYAFWAWELEQQKREKEAQNEK